MVCSTLRALLSDTFLQRKDVVNQCLEFAWYENRELSQKGVSPSRSLQGCIIPKLQTLTNYDILAPGDSGSVEQVRQDHLN